LLDSRKKSMDKIAIFYGPEGGNTEKAARMVAKEFGEETAVLIPVRGATEMDLEPYDRIIFGGPTVGTHTWRDDTTNKDWDLFLTRISQSNLEGKKCAIFGLGDHVGYAHHFVDDIGVLAQRLEGAGAKLVGFVPVSDYTFEESLAQRGEIFLGLPLDEDHEADKTQGRISNWVLQLQKELG
jgi:flavodoxin I